MVECNVVDRGGAPGSSGIPVGPPPGGGTPTNPPPPIGNPGEDDESNNFCRDNHCLPFPEEVLGIDCKSFLFSSVGSNWQEAGVSGVRFKVVYVDGSIRESREITIPRPLYFGLPKNHHIEGNISEDEASNIAAGATQRASDLTSALLQSNPQMNDIQLQNSFKKYLEGQLFYYGGRVSFYPSPGYAGAVFPAKYKFLGNGDC
jgi:hypothetical protein